MDEEVWHKKEKEIKSVQQVKLGLGVHLIHTLVLTLIWLHLSIVKTLTMLKEQRARKERRSNG
ncbi:hypothetical protein LFDSGCCC_CDS0044 [Phage C75C1]|nr:hypothetical protein LFDSGCCC_CDS0044 [Phage C75C1]